MKMKALAHAILLALGLMLTTGLMLAAGCSSLATTATTTQTQQIETACASASLGIKSLSLAESAGALTAADTAAVNSAIQIVQPVCTGPAAPTYSAVAVDSITTAVAELTALAAKYKTPAQ